MCVCVRKKVGPTAGRSNIYFKMFPPSCPRKAFEPVEKSSRFSIAFLKLLEVQEMALQSTWVTAFSPRFISAIR